MAVNVHHGRPPCWVEHLEDRIDVHVSLEEERALAPRGRSRTWPASLDGRGALVVNADTVHAGTCGRSSRGGTGRRVRVLATPTRTPDPMVGRDRPSVRAAGSWRRSCRGSTCRRWCRNRRGCGAAVATRARGGSPGRGDGDRDRHRLRDPEQYLQANLWVSGGRSVIGAGAVVRGRLERSVVWRGRRSRTTSTSSTPSEPTWAGPARAAPPCSSADRVLLTTLSLSPQKSGTPGAAPTSDQRRRAGGATAVVRGRRCSWSHAASMSELRCRGPSRSPRRRRSSAKACTRLRDCRGPRSRGRVQRDQVSRWPAGRSHVGQVGGVPKRSLTPEIIAHSKLGDGGSGRRSPGTPRPGPAAGSDG